MYIKEIELENFRNYDNQKISLNKDINIIYGNNAQGKTNIIEAIYLCAYGKSFRAKKDSDLIRFNEKEANSEIEFFKVDRDSKISFNINEQKTFFINGIKQNKISDIIGRINVIIFTPDDINIIKGGPQRRRKFIDMMISSLRPNYIHLLNTYNKALEQRNNYLKQIKNENKSIDLLDIWDEQLADLDFKIYEYRNEYIEKIYEKIKDIHSLITKSGNLIEELKLKYISTGTTKEQFLENLKKSRNIDINRGFTGVGIHRDDIVFYINKKPVSVFGSQGQQRTVVLSLKLAELRVVSDTLGDTPILLLDDFMSELDEKRRKVFLEKIKDNQVIITCTDYFEINSENKKVYYIENGKCNERK